MAKRPSLTKTLAEANRSIEAYERNPKAYTQGSFKNVNAGRICGIIGIVLNAAIIMFGIIMLIVMGAGLTEFLQDFPWEEYV